MSLTPIRGPTHTLGSFHDADADGTVHAASYMWARGLLKNSNRCPATE